jgi:hypothetical protein
MVQQHVAADQQQRELPALARTLSTVKSRMSVPSMSTRPS